MVRALVTCGRLLRALLALVILGGLVGGVPWLLATVTGWPLDWIGWPQPADLPTLTDITTAVTSPWSDEMLLALLSTVGWALWGLFVRSLLAEAIIGVVGVQARRNGMPPPPSAGRRGPLRAVAAVLVGAIAGAILLDPSRSTVHATTASVADADAAAHRPAITVPIEGNNPPATTRADEPSQRSATAAHSPRPAATRTIDHADRGDQVPSGARQAAHGVHTVVAGDNLWDIAEEKLGDPHRWREIYVLNRDKPQPNGYALTDPDQIHVGWVLALPARDPAPAATTPPSRTPATTPQPTEQAEQAAKPPQRSTMPPTTVTTPPPATTAPATTAPGGTAPATTAPDATASVPAPESDATAHTERGVSLPSQGWISLGLAAAIAALATLLRLHRRRHARLSFPIPLRTGAQPRPVPDALTAADIAGIRDLDHDTSKLLPGVRPSTPPIAAPMGVDDTGTELSLFTLPGAGITLCGDGAEPAARAILAAALTNGVLDSPDTRPVVVTTIDLITRLLPDHTAPLDVDGDRLIVLADTAAAVTHAEEEMIARRRLLDMFGVDTVADLNARTDHAEHQPPYVLLATASARHTGRITAVGAHRIALDLYPILVSDADTEVGGDRQVDGLARLDVATDGTIHSLGDGAGRLSTLTAADLGHVFAMLAEAAPSLHAGTDSMTITVQSTQDTTEPVDEIPTPEAGSSPVVHVSVLGPTTVTTAAGPVTTGMRSGSYAVLAVLSAYPAGRTLGQITAAIHPDIDEKPAVKRIRTDITTARRALRQATGDPEGRFIVYEPTTGRYRLDPNTIAVDLWQMLTAIARANTAADDKTALSALYKAAGLYQGDFGDGHDRAWAADFATTYRHQILSVYARIAEILETDHPDQAITALERAIHLDPVNEELYQRIIRIHGRHQRPDAVRRTLRLLEDRLADLDTEPSEATRRIAARQLHPVLTPAGVPG